MRHSLRAVSLSWLIVLVPILAGSSAGADGNERVPKNDARPCNLPSCAAARTRNEAPIARNDAAITAMDTTVTINVTANDRDPDGRIARKTVRIVGARPRHGRAGKQRNGTVIYTPDPGFSGQDTFRYRVKDNRGALSKRARVQVTVLSGGLSPVANNDTAATAANTPVVINVVANDTDADGNLDPRSVAIPTNPASGGLVNRFDGTVTYTPSAGFFGTDAFAYTVRDGRGATSNVATVTVAVNGGPVADAGPDRNAATGEPVTLNGSASFDPDRNTLAFSWRFLSIPPTSARVDADIVNPTSPAPSFTPDVDGDYELELTVNDGGLSDTDGVVITAAATGRVAPNAAAGPDQNAALGQTVSLDGRTSSDPDQGPRPLSFTWSFAQKPGGSNANIRNAAAAQASFVPDLIGLYVVTLAVSDGALGDQDEVQINVTVSNAPPNADAGADLVVQLGPPAETAVLNGTGSNDPDQRPLAFQWSFVSVAPGSALTNRDITDANTARPRFTPDVAGNYVLRLEASDGTDTDDDQVMVKANAAPVAAGNAYSVFENDTLRVPRPGVLGNDTDANGDPLTAVLNSAPSHSASFGLLRRGGGAFSYRPDPNFTGSDSFTYHANDGSADSNVVTVKITVRSELGIVDPNAPICGDGVVILPEECDDGNTTDGDGCSSTCRVEPAQPICGDGTRTPPEQCDDGNTTSGDGCSSTCKTELPITGRPPSFFQIRAIFNDNSSGNACTSSGCHGSGNFEPDLTSDDPSDHLVNRPSSACSGRDRVEPGNADESCLFRKITGASGAGSRMPLVPPFPPVTVCSGERPAPGDPGRGTCLRQDQINTIEAWIRSLD